MYPDLERLVIASVLAQDTQGSAEGSEASPASTAESQEVLTEMRKGTTLLTKDQEQAGMERLLNQGTRSVRRLPSHLAYACLVSQACLVKIAMPPSSALSSIVPSECYLRRSKSRSLHEYITIDLQLGCTTDLLHGLHCLLCQSVEANLVMLSAG